MSITSNFFERFIIKNTTDKILQIIKENSHEISKNIILLAPYLKKNSKLRQLIEKHKIYASIVCYEDDENQMINILRSKLNENGIKIVKLDVKLYQIGYKIS